MYHLKCLKILRCEMREIRIVQITYRRQVLLDSDLGFLKYGTISHNTRQRSTKNVD